MKMTATTVRRGLYGMLGGGLMGAAASATIALPTANAAPATCTANGVANTVNSVSASIGDYLETHPDANQALSDIAKQPAPQADASFHAYSAGHPQIANDLRNIQRPLSDLNTQCGIQVSPSQVVTAFQAL